MLGIRLAINGVTERLMITDEPNYYGVFVTSYEFEIVTSLELRLL